MNNSATHPQLRRQVAKPVRNWYQPSTACGRPITHLTRGFADSSTIHNPYYDYFIGLQQRAVRRKGIICAYPS